MNGWIVYLALAQPAERIPYYGPTRRELGLIFKVLELATAALIYHVVGTARIYSER
jgi:hypothetical protein